MIKPETYYEVTCDQCGCVFDEDDTIIAFSSERDAMESIMEAGWRKDSAGRILCPACIEEDNRKD